MSKTLESNLAIHPGELLAEELDRPAQVVNEIVRGKKAITAKTAIQLEEALGIPAHLWLNMQSEHDLTLARQARHART